MPLRANAPATEVKRWMLGSMCYDCPHKIFTNHVTIRSPNVTRHNDPNNRAELMFIPFKTKKKITDVFPFPMSSLLSGLSLALNKEGCDWQDRHSARANSGRATHRSQTRYTPLVEVNQAILAWSFRQMVSSWDSNPLKIVPIDPLSVWKVILFQSG